MYYCFDVCLIFKEKGDDIFVVNMYCRVIVLLFWCNVENCGEFDYGFGGKVLFNIIMGIIC